VSCQSPCLPYFSPSVISSFSGHVPLSIMSIHFFSSPLFLEQSPLVQNLLSKIPLLLPLLAFVIYKGRG
jgi:hypothetical protein